MTATGTTTKQEYASAAPRPEVSTLRLHALRALYFLMALFLVTSVAPLLAEEAPTHMTSVSRALLAALGLLALLGVRYPLKMLPLMLFELLWKALWFGFYGLPAWSAGNMAGAYAESFEATGIGIILVILVVPWKYVFNHYVAATGDRWRTGQGGHGRG